VLKLIASVHLLDSLSAFFCLNNYIHTAYSPPNTPWMLTTPYKVHEAKAEAKLKMGYNKACTS